jgi:hypothetical protein
MKTLEAWRLLEAEVNGRQVVGMPGVRDPEHPCEEYVPTEDADLLGLWITAEGSGSCDSDGHYLCGGCRQLSERGLQERGVPVRGLEERSV